jgi:hypothetical protein
MKILKTSKYHGRYGNIIWRDIGYDNEIPKYGIAVSYMIDLLDLYDINDFVNIWKNGRVNKVCTDGTMSSKNLYDIFVQQVLNAKVKDILYDYYHKNIKYMILLENTTVLDVLDYYSNDEFFRLINYGSNETFIDAVIEMENQIHTINDCNISHL